MQNGSKGTNHGQPQSDLKIPEFKIDLGNNFYFYLKFHRQGEEEVWACGRVEPSMAELNGSLN